MHQISKGPRENYVPQCLRHSSLLTFRDNDETFLLLGTIKAIKNNFTSRDEAFVFWRFFKK